MYCLKWSSDLLLKSGGEDTEAYPIYSFLIFLSIEK